METRSAFTRLFTFARVPRHFRQIEQVFAFEAQFAVGKEHHVLEWWNKNLWL